MEDTKQNEITDDLLEKIKIVGTPKEIAAYKKLLETVQFVQHLHFYLSETKLGGKFIWENTHEGQKFWSKLSTKLIDSGIYYK